MVRPRSRQRRAEPDPSWKHLIIDGYIDEPASLGVPPYLSPRIRSLAGGLVSGGSPIPEIGYITVDQWRETGKELGSKLLRLESVILMAGCVVPGKYLRGTPVSSGEAVRIFQNFDAPVKVVTGSASHLMAPDDAASHSGDPGVLGEGIASGRSIISRESSRKEWDAHLLNGAFVAKMHPDHPSPLICEVETSTGCPRFVSGGCSFCIEPLRGPVRFREPEEVIAEVEALSSHGVENIRIGGQSDLVSYLSGDVGRCEVPEPDPEPLKTLMTGAKRALHGGKGVKAGVRAGRRKGIDTGIVHTDNANPAVISAYPEASKQALEAIAEGCTSGSVLALGLESADPAVKEANNLNSTPEDVHSAVRLMNSVGGGRGPNGLPLLLPGLNFLGGLPGQTPASFDHDIRLLKNILSEGLLLRRINIRAVILKDVSGSGRSVVKGRFPRAFREFKRKVRDVYDHAFLDRMLPAGSVIRGVFVETSVGRVRFGRQIGSYPILVGIPHTVDEGIFADVAVTGVSSRSVTGFRTPFDLKNASFRDLTALPGIGKKRAATLFEITGKGETPPPEMFDGNEWVREHLVMWQ